MDRKGTKGKDKGSLWPLTTREGDEFMTSLLQRWKPYDTATLRRYFEFITWSEQQALPSQKKSIQQILSNIIIIRRWFYLFVTLSRPTNSTDPENIVSGIEKDIEYLPPNKNAPEGKKGNRLTNI